MASLETTTSRVGQDRAGLRQNPYADADVARQWGLHRAGLRAGMRFLDVASGSGALSIPAARMGASVLATDLVRDARSPEGARTEEGLDIETRVTDGHALEIEDDSFDMAGSQFGVMLLPDMPKPSKRWSRAVRPGDRVLMNVYGDPHEIEFLGFLITAIQSVRLEVTGPSMEPLPLPFQLQDPERLRRELTIAGLKHVNVETITETTEFETGQALWAWLIWSNPIVETVLGDLNLTKREATVVTLQRLVEERANGLEVAALTNPIHIGVGVK
ncbi:MAG: class I SAM-dependent methyltransferase [Hyphomicrobiales bacterium]